MRTATVYTETVVHLAPTKFAADAPYQVAIVETESGERLTVRIAGERVGIGDAVAEADPIDGVAFFRKS